MIKKTFNRKRKPVSISSQGEKIVKRSCIHHYEID